MRYPTGTRLLMLLAVLSLVCLGLSCGSSGGGSPSPASDRASGDPVTPRKVTFMAGYRAQADLPFVAAYVAQEKGFFAEEKLQVEIQHSGGQDEHIQLLLSGRIEFTTDTAAQVVRRRSDPGIPVVAIALFTQRGDQGFIALKESGIQTPKQWEGKTMGIKVLPTAEYLGMLKTQGVDRSKVREVSVPFDPRILCERKVDVLPVFLSNEPNIVRTQCGMDVNVWDPSDYNIPTLGLTYITRTNLAQTDPDVVRRFLRATMRGLAYAQENRAEAIDIVLKYAQGADAQHLRYMMDTEFNAAVTPQTQSNGLGWMTAEQWNALQELLLSQGIITSPTDVRQMFDDRFLREIYRNGQVAP